MGCTNLLRWRAPLPACLIGLPRLPSPSPPVIPTAPPLILRPILTLAQAYGPSSGKAVAKGAEGVTYTSWKFLATPAAGGAGILAVANQPEVWWYNLTPNTKYIVTVVGVQADGKEVAAANSLPMTTPNVGKLNIVSAIPLSPTNATVTLKAPPGTKPTSYDVKLCRQPRLIDCVIKKCLTNICNFDNLAPGVLYNVTATALIGGKVVPASNWLPLQMPDSRPSIKVASSPPVGITTATAIVTPPIGTAPNRKPWKKYELKICPAATPAACVKRACNNPPKPHPATSTCSLTGLTRGTRYSVEVGAVHQCCAAPQGCKQRCCMQRWIGLLCPELRGPLRLG